MIYNKIIYEIGASLRNPNLFKFIGDLKKTDNWDREALELLQINRLKDLLRFAYKYSPYYRKLYDELKFDIEQISKIGDISNLPIIEKSELIKNKHLIQSTAKFKSLRFSETSGTTGKALGIYRSEEWDSATRAAMMRGYSWYNIDPWERNGYLWGYNMSHNEILKTKILDSLQNRFRLFSYSDDEINDFCRKLKNASYISGYSSMIYEVAKRVNALGLSNSFPNLRMVKGTSEKIYPSYQEEVKKAFGQKMISEYGAMETGIIAFECPEGGNMHIAMEHVILEEIDGAAVVTNLMSHSFPIIRYKLGDAIQLAPRDYKCSCGRSHPVLLNVLGRVGNVIHGKTKDYPSLTFYYIFKNIALKKGIALNYQAIQNKKGELHFRIEQEKTDVIDAAIQNEINKYFSNDISYIISYSENLHSHNTKLKDFIQNIP